MRVAEVKALESEGDDYNQQKKRLAKPVFLKKRYILQLSLKFHYSFTFYNGTGHILWIWICGCSLFYRREVWASKSAGFNSTKSLKICGCKR